jgi:hypothetical protein
VEDDLLLAAPAEVRDYSVRRHGRGRQVTLPCAAEGARGKPLGSMTARREARAQMDKPSVDGDLIV